MTKTPISQGFSQKNRELECKVVNAFISNHDDFVFRLEEALLPGWCREQTYCLPL